MEYSIYAHHIPDILDLSLPLKDPKVLESYVVL
jgi:hypothetical protein